MWRASERRAEIARWSERASTPCRAPRRQKSAQIRGRAVGEIGDFRRLAEPHGKEGEKLPRVAAVGLEGTSRKPPLVGEMGEPTGGGRGKAGRGGQRGEFSQVGGLRHGEAR